MDIKDKTLTVEISNHVLVISIGVSQLQHAVEIGRAYGYGDIEITNKAQFLEGFVNKLSSEDEDGSTLIHRAFDLAVTKMLEDGELGVEELECL